ncbi:MAG: A/G-specific adenine glycosylase [Candidatus Sumerlaeia bacterium]|nr:A/G-specific adenine glycosylase [Candidatus Sumerlaeia bacterium]
MRRRLLAWYRRQRRDLPWRGTRDPYAVWVSEIMLQQTTVAAAVPFYERWMARFPTLESLATAPEEDVLTLWAGLGYYNRAKNLHRAARQIQNEFTGRIPGTVEALMTLPGVGRYTAGAIASIAFGRRTGAVDANAARVLARLFGVREPIASAVGQERLWEFASVLAQTAHPGDLNQAIMELGALVCSPTAPRCHECALRPLCRAATRGDQDRLPVLPPRPGTVEITEVGAVIERDGRFLVLQRAEGSRMAGMWEFPHGAVADGEPETALAGVIAGALDATAVLTTASDARQTLAVDLLGRELGWTFEASHDEIVRASAAVVNDEPVAVVQEVGSADWWPRHANGRNGPLPANLFSFSRLEDVTPERFGAVLWISHRPMPAELAPRLAGKRVIYRPPVSP